jgi:hypothetical protein
MEERKLNESVQDPPPSEDPATQENTHTSETESTHSESANPQQTHHRIRKFFVFAILGVAVVAFMLFFQRRETGKAKTPKPATSR